MSYDVIIVGAGHNGLTTAAYLARAGLRVKVLEKRNIVGGACVTEEFHPGFRNSTCAYVVGLLSPKVIADLELKKHGLEIIPAASGTLTLLSPDDYIFIPSDETAAKKEIAKFSAKDAEIHAEFLEELSRFGKFLNETAHQPAYNLGSGWRDWRGWLNGLKHANRFRKLSAEDKAKLIKLFTQSLGDYLNSWFESEAVKGHYGFEDMASPWSGGSAYSLLHHAFGKINGAQGAWGHVKGGMGGITQAMAKSAMESGVEIETGAAVEKVLTENVHGQIQTLGVRLTDGQEIKAPMVAANCTPKILFRQLVDPAVLPHSFNHRIKNWRCKGSSLRMNIALSELPDFTALEDWDQPDTLGRMINICPSLDYVETAYRDASVRGWSRHPMMSMFIPSVLDDTLAPAGQHVMSLDCLHFNYDLPDGLNWDNVKDEAVETIISTVEKYAPNFRSAILGIQALSPKDLESEYSLTGGDVFHGEMTMDQLFSLRPAPGYADYRTPVEHLYMCGSGTHPGGGVTGLPGMLAAQEILKDAKKIKKAA